MGFKLDDQPEETSTATEDKSSEEFVPTQADVNLEVLMTRIRGLVMKNRYRVKVAFGRCP